jgi:hypothetical protein
MDIEEVGCPRAVDVDEAQPPRLEAVGGLEGLAQK